jgi:hypothetical protein
VLDKSALYGKGISPQGCRATVRGYLSLVQKKALGVKLGDLEDAECLYHRCACWRGPGTRSHTPSIDEQETFWSFNEALPTGSAMGIAYYARRM